MTTVKFEGAAQFQASSGETVTISVTLPDSSVQTLTAVTQADGSYSATATYVIAGNYKAKSHIDADAIYQAADSPERAFTISLTARTLTLNVTL